MVKVNYSTKVTHVHLISIELYSIYTFLIEQRKEKNPQGKE